MPTRCLYFTRNNILYYKPFDIIYDKEAFDYTKVECAKRVRSQLESWMPPLVDVSGVLSTYLQKTLSIFNVKDSNDRDIKTAWELLGNSEGKEYLPQGAYELVYLSNLNEQQLLFALCPKVFFDFYHDPDKVNPSPAKACASLQLLYGQNKLEYLEDYNKFLHWFMSNCARPVLWSESKEK